MPTSESIPRWVLLGAFAIALALASSTGWFYNEAIVVLRNVWNAAIPVQELTSALWFICIHPATARRRCCPIIDTYFCYLFRRTIACLTSTGGTSAIPGFWSVVRSIPTRRSHGSSSGFRYKLQSPLLGFPLPERSLLLCERSYT